LSFRLECGEQYAFVIPEDCEHYFPVGWCHLKFSWQATQDDSIALMHTLSRVGNGEPKTHHLWQFGLAYRVLDRGSNGKGSYRLVLTAGQRIVCCWFSGACETMGQVPQCTGRLCLEIKVYFKSVLFCLFKFYIHL
jgi:hypothetical protein